MALYGYESRVATILTSLDGSWAMLSTAQALSFRRKIFRNVALSPFVFLESFEGALEMESCKLPIVMRLVVL